MLNPRTRYEFIATLGSGATSRVDKARDATIGRTVAVKTFLHGLGSGDTQKQFLREAQIIGRLTSPYIVGLYDVGTNEDGVPFLVMEYIEGETLEKILSAGPLPLERAAVWAADLASALARAHQCKVIHGDVKPANIMVTKEGQVKLGDFGVARFATQVSGSGSILGTPAYLSPEQILGHQQDTRSDLFSLGIILYQMTTGVRPFDGTSVGAVCAQIVSAEPAPPSHHNPELPPAFDRIVMRCLAKDPARRYSDAESLGASLYPFARSKPVPAPRPGQFWWKRPMQASDLRIAAIVLFGLGLVGMGARELHRASSTASLRPQPFTAVASSHGSASNSSQGLSASPSDSLINVGAADLSRAASPSENQTAISSEDDLNGQVARPNSSGNERPAPVPSVSHALERHAVAPAKPRNPNSTSAMLNSSATASSAAKLESTAPLQKNPGVPQMQTSLRVDIVSSVPEGTLSIYSGTELLLTMQLQQAHLGDTLRFDCPITPGEHSFRVVLARADESVLMEKENTSQIRADGGNFLGVHVTRHVKVPLLKHEGSLEVVWPSSPAPIAASMTAHSDGQQALR